MDTDNVIIHVRFAPDGSVVEVGERPSAVSPQDWYFRLCEGAADNYQPLSGGRAVFRLTRGAVDALKGAAAA
jgi:hypothetical protein